MRYNQGESIRNHYDLIGPYYRSLRQTAHEPGEDFVHFLDSFAAMKRGYEARALEYQLVISRKPGPARTESG